MVKEISHTEELLISLDKAFSNFFLVLNEFDQLQLNTLPFEGSWSAAQVADHVTKSNRSIAKALLLKGAIINRNPFERVQELKGIFLDFSTKLKSPDFILPDEDHFEKETVISKLLESLRKIKEAATHTELLEMINHPAFGDITKFEILHFVVYHTQRHAHQLENIFRAVKT